MKLSERHLYIANKKTIDGFGLLLMEYIDLLMRRIELNSGKSQEQFTGIVVISYF